MKNKSQTIWRLSKYNPARRDCAGCYPADEWTSVSDIGKSFTGIMFTQDEYLRVEKQYVSTIMGIAHAAGQRVLG